MIGVASLVLTVLVSTASCSDDLRNKPIEITTYKRDMADKVELYLYTKNTANNPVMSKVNDNSLFGGRIDLSKQVKIIIHGYLSKQEGGFSKQMREAYLNRGDYNVINIDWSKDAYSIYNAARKDVPAVGKVVARMIDRLVSENRVRLGNIHIVGHSLGAHIAGVAGLNVKVGKLPRVTGLDPAGPLFSYNDGERLKPESANFVDVIHTCGKGLGFLGELGHVDFYPNDGTASQPGCPGASMGTCSHGRAIDFFAESLSNSRGFMSKQCGDWKTFKAGNCARNGVAYMGEYVAQNVRGKYYLKTGERSPFGIGQGGA